MDNSDCESPSNTLVAKTKHQKVQVAIHKHIHGFTWAWFVFPLATLGLSLVLITLPYRFNGLTTIGKVIYLLGVTEVVLLLGIISLRFLIHRGSFMRSIARESELFFVATALLCLASTILGAELYGKPHENSNLSSALRVFFWIYICLAFCFSLYAHYILFDRGHLLVADMTPAWILPSFPIILSGVVAGTITPNLTPAHRFPILIAGVTFQGVGLLMSLMIYSIYLFRLFQSHLPQPNARPGMFLAVGPPAFSGLAFIKMSNAIPADYSYFAKHPGAVDTLQTMGLFFAIFLWTLAWWFCTIAIIACVIRAKYMRFHLTWYSFVFPNAGLMIALLEIGMSLDCKAIGWVGTAGAIVLGCTWLFVNAFHIEALIRGRELI